MESCTCTVTLADIVLETRDREPFLDDAWVGGTLVFGYTEPRPAVSVTVRDVRCMMITLDPDTGTQDARVLKTVVRLNENNAGSMERWCKPEQSALATR